MFYHLHWLGDLGWPAFGAFKAVMLRAVLAAVFAFVLCLILGPRLIAFLKSRKCGENTAKKDSLFLQKKHMAKNGTPTMGGVLLIGATLTAIALFARFDVVFVPMAFFTLLSLMLVGFYDDWIKLTHNKRDGLSRKEKLFYQFLIGGGMGLLLAWYNEPSNATNIAIPFLDAALWPVLGYFYVAWASVVMVGTSNAVNLTDGLDGLATLCTISVAVAFGVLAYFSGHAGIASHLGVVRIPGAEELTIVCAALCGACLGFLWFNAHPAEVFMGDTGSLAMGGLIGLVALCIKQELMLLLIGGIFVVEALSVIIQIYSCKLRNGKRVFLLAPLHHHFEQKGWDESKIVARFFIVSVLLAVFSIALLRLK